MLYPKTLEALEAYDTFCADNCPNSFGTWDVRLKKDALRRLTRFAWWREFGRERGHDRDSYLYNANIDLIRGYLMSDKEDI